MAFDSSSNGPASRPAATTSPPEAPRPRAEIWTSLRGDGIQWEGQALIAGDGIDIPTLLVLSENRFVLLCEGEIALDVPRSWLRPEPRLLADDGVRISITPQGSEGASDDTDRLTVRVREGRGAAARLVGAISGRLVTSRETRGIRQTETPAGWDGAVGAATPIALPPLPDFGDPLPAKAARSWPPIEQQAVPPAQAGVAAATATAAAAAASGWPATAASEATDTRATHTVTPRRGAAGAAAPDPVAAEDQRQFSRGLVWGLRTLILAVLVGAGAYFGRDSLPTDFTVPLPAAVQERFGLNDETPTPEVSQLPAEQQAGSQGAETPEPTTADSDGTNGAQNSDVIGTSSSDEGGLGGDNGSEITPVNPGIGEYAEPTDEPIATQAPAPTQAPEPTQEPVVETPDANDGEGDTITVGDGDTIDEATTAPEVVPTEEPDVVPTDEPPTEAPVTEAPATEEPVTEEPVTEQPATETPVTEEPATESPVTEEPATESPVTEQPATEAPASETPSEEPTLESQPPSVDPGIAPEQALASGDFRYAITGAERGATIADLPDLAATGTGEWVVLSMVGENWSDTEQVFDMSQFKLYADGQEVQLDVGNAWIGGLLGYTPAYGNTDAILWAADESHPFALTFLVPTGAGQLTLVAGDQAIDLGSALAAPAPLAQDAGETEKPEYIEATVVEVLDAESIVIEQNGIQQTVRYLGIDVPTGDDCFATEATEANRTLVEGQTVRLERQATDVDARGNWVRDVWAPTADGRYVLVSNALVAEGAATAGISEPNTRYAGWLMGSQSVAKAEERGLWGTCGEEGNAQVSSQLAAILPVTARTVHFRKRR